MRQITNPSRRTLSSSSFKRPHVDTYTWLCMAFATAVGGHPYSVEDIHNSRVVLSRWQLRGEYQSAPMRTGDDALTRLSLEGG